jgi:hypothetical protein
MSWGKPVIGGVERDLTHLDSAVMTVTSPLPGAAAIRVLVTFGCHCFARDLQAGDPVDHHIPDGLVPRCFCLDRYANSTHLWRIIRGAAGGLAFFSQDSNMLLVERLPGLIGPYAIAFNVRKSSARGIDVAMFVASAYEKPNLTPAMPAVPFSLLIDRASKGLTPFKPQKKKKW